MKTIAELTTAFVGAVNETDTFRITKKLATAILLDNTSVIRRGNVYYIAIKDLGLGICEVGLRPHGRKNTFLVKSLIWDQR